MIENLPATVSCKQCNSHFIHRESGKATEYKLTGNLKMFKKCKCTRGTRNDIQFNVIK